jgi:predicted ATPase/DNA-binding SARP family transcriptional activator
MRRSIHPPGRVVAASRSRQGRVDAAAAGSKYGWRVEVGVLGPLVVDGSDSRVSSRQQRAVLALLALRAPRAVSTADLTHAVWGDELPGRAVKTLQGLIARLRSTLPSGSIETVTGGYRFAGSLDDVDCHRFERASRSGRAALRDGDLTRAVQDLSYAESLWRGDPLVDVDEIWVRGEMSRLVEVRLAVVEDLIETKLLSGSDPTVIADAEAAVAVEPLRERRWGLLVRCLHAAGRRAEALRAFQRARTYLAEELGVPPSAELLTVEQKILQDGEGPLASAGWRPPARSISSLPRQLTSFLGRDEEMRTLSNHLCSASLVTVTGPPGVGKTRLAVEAASAVVETKAMTAAFVDLTAVGALDDATAALARALGIDAEAAVIPLDAIIDQLLGERTLLIVDNCEQVVDQTADLVTSILHRAPETVVLATSREPLAVRGEVVLALAPLSLPAPDVNGAEVLGWAAVQLLADRVGASSDAHDQHHLAGIARQLDGLPLALELAAGCIATLGAQETAVQLTDRFGLLRSAGRDRPMHHRTLESVIAWSWDLLTAAERHMLELLCVFRGPFSLAAAQEVALDESTSKSPREPVVDLVRRLVAKSLVEVDHDRQDGSRYRLLESIRAYGWVRLAQRGEADGARDRHCRWVLRRLAAADHTGRSPGAGPTSVDALEVSSADLDGALEWTTRDPGLAAEALSHLVRLMVRAPTSTARATSSLRWI